MLTNFLCNNQKLEKVYQKSHYQIAINMSNFDFDQTVEGPKIEPHNNEKVYPNKTECFPVKPVGW